MKRYGRYDSRTPKPEIKDRVSLLFTLFALILGGIYVVVSAFLARENAHPVHVTMMHITGMGLVFPVGVWCLFRLARLAQIDFLKMTPDLLEQKTRLALAYRWVGLFAAVVGVLAAFGVIPNDPPKVEPAETPAMIGPRD